MGTGLHEFRSIYHDHIDILINAILIDDILIDDILIDDILIDIPLKSTYRYRCSINRRQDHVRKRPRYEVDDFSHH